MFCTFLIVCDKIIKYNAYFILFRWNRFNLRKEHKMNTKQTYKPSNFSFSSHKDCSYCDLSGALNCWQSDVTLFVQSFLEIGSFFYARIDSIRWNSRHVFWKLREGNYRSCCKWWQSRLKIWQIGFDSRTSESKLRGNANVGELGLTVNQLLRFSRFESYFPQTWVCDRSANVPDS